MSVLPPSRNNFRISTCGQCAWWELDENYPHMDRGACLCAASKCEFRFRDDDALPCFIDRNDDALPCFIDRKD